MLTQIKELDDNARIWVFQSDRELSESEQEAINSATAAFLNQWAAHGAQLKASSEVRADHFLIIAIDEAFQQASGCSIDAMVRFVQELGQKTGLNFFERSNLAFLLNDQVSLINMKDLKAEIEVGNIQSNSQFFDNTIKTKGELENSWCVKANESWLARYFKTTANV